MTAARIFLALSAEYLEDFYMVSRAISGTGVSRFTIINEPLLDLLLKAKEGQVESNSRPDLIIAFYRDLFTDLKIIAELRKLPEFQWTPIYVVVSEDITNTRTRFLQVGVSAVIPFYHGSDMASIADEIIEHYQRTLGRLQPARVHQQEKQTQHIRQSNP